MCYLLVPRELAPLEPQSGKGGQHVPAAWATKLVGIGSLFTQRRPWPQFPLSIERIMQTVEITKHAVDIEEKGVRLRLTIVDTPGFGDAVNNTEWYVWPSTALGVTPIMYTSTGKIPHMKERVMIMYNVTFPSGQLSPL